MASNIAGVTGGDCVKDCALTASCFDIRSHEIPPHGSELADRYVFLMSELADKHGSVKAMELTRRLGVNAATVTRNLQRLETAGLVQVERHKGARLTDEGRQLADIMRYRHETLARFLLIHGVKPCTAQKEAVRLMSDLSPETLRVFATLLAERMAFKDRESCTVVSCSCQQGECLQSRLRSTSNS
ncbi:MAG: MarR family transcriptional regulator [Armatimonadetes bacterium]|nr:MarR family transcriptional regulator [Armatimonadota bacterium]